MAAIKRFATMSSSMIRNIIFAAALLVFAAAPGVALGQAWVGVKNNLNLSLDYTYSPSDQIVESEGQAYDGPGIGSVNHSVTLAAEYTPIENLAVNASVPIVTTKYFPDAASVFPGHGANDDGNFHSSLQDFKMVARYMVLDNRPIALSPHIGFSIPMANYETQGYASTGRGLKQLHLGLSVGKFFTEGPLQSFYVHLNYEFSLAEKYKTVFPETEAYGQNRSDIHTIVGYFISDKIEVNLGADYRKVHGGLDFLDYAMLPEWVQYHHDALLAESMLLAGAGATYEPMEGLRFNLGLRSFLSGTNTRSPNAVYKPFIVTFGLSWDAI
jgi:hypothetical protein